MSEIPSAIAGSAAQAAFQAFEASKQQDARRADQANAVTQQVRGIDESGNTVDTADADNQVFADAEGAGGQGRAFDESVGEDPAQSDHADGTALDARRTDDDGVEHIDLEA